MAVVISEFEVVTEPTTPQTRATAAPSPPAVEIREVERIVAADRARALRVRAY
jgi:hypothetical protein